jgi:dethiobiotin synthetase
MTRPDRLIVVVGTATEVGKTFASARLARMATQRGSTVSIRKPVQSFDPDDDAPTDAAVLALATGEDPDMVCAPERTYPVPMAPPMAADVLGLHCPTLAELIDGIVWPHATCDLGFIETVGGVRSPVAPDGDSRDLALGVRPDAIVLVADAGLGTINDVRHAAEALPADPPLVVILNRFDPQSDLHRRNHAWLRDVDGLTVATSLETTLDAVYR